MAGGGGRRARGAGAWRPAFRAEQDARSAGRDVRLVREAGAARRVGGAAERARGGRLSRARGDGGRQTGDVCLLVVLSRIVPEWPLIVAANRDEQYARPADPVMVLREQPRTLGGRDRLAGGTWLAVNEHGVVAGLTNQPMQRSPTRRSRGAIPLKLTEGADAGHAVAAFTSSATPAEFNPCWALAADRSGLFYLDLTRADALVAIELEPGVYILENRALGAPSPKVDRVRARLGDVAAREPDDVLDALCAVLTDHVITAAPEGDDAWSQLVSRASACCVHTEVYGTRSSVLIRVPRAPDAPPQMWGSDGPSCTHPLRPLATT